MIVPSDGGKWTEHFQFPEHFSLHYLILVRIPEMTCGWGQQLSHLRNWMFREMGNLYKVILEDVWLRAVYCMRHW